ncbi:DUF3618 domain-containing protein [Actinoalloteichus spitiensis]|uniref:DUF3618 domain-containing protein n=1 Tax=Actinoalloteichus spitiensis TaxID=252394 RepID=UPI00036D6BDD|nr:DUF3618 domain-containing protein [Actinoalloteichus spitiensis]
MSHRNGDREHGGRHTATRGRWADEELRRDIEATEHELADTVADLVDRFDVRGRVSDLTEEKLHSLDQAAARLTEKAPPQVARQLDRGREAIRNRPGATLGWTVAALLVLVVLGRRRLHRHHHRGHRGMGHFRHHGPPKGRQLDGYEVWEI